MLDCAGDAESLVQGSVKALPAGLACRLSAIAMFLLLR